MITGGRAKRRFFAGADLTPMIDVVLQLIIFFMFTSQFSQLIRSPIDLPKEKGDPASPAASEEVVIDVGPTGAVLVEGEPVSFDRALQLLAAEVREKGERPELVQVLVRADRNAPAGSVNRIAEALARLDIRAWRLGTAGEAP